VFTVAVPGATGATKKLQTTFRLFILFKIRMILIRTFIIAVQFFLCTSEAIFCPETDLKRRA
jgi:hypothetical protein